MKKATRVIDGREALPVRAVPLVTNWDVTANNLAQKLSDVDDKPSFTAYWYNNGNPIPIRPESWGMTLDCLEDMVRALKNSELKGNDNRQIAWRKSLELLPAGVFVWVDEFAEWYRATYIARDTVWVEQHRVIGEDDDPEPVFHQQRSDALELCPINLREFEPIIFEGFETPEKLTASLVAANSIEDANEGSMIGLLPSSNEQLKSFVREDEDFMSDPAQKADAEYGFNLVSRIDEVRRRIDTYQSMRSVTPTEFTEQLEQVNRLQFELDELERQSRTGTRPLVSPAAMLLDGATKPANNWDEHGLQRLLSESREPGMTHQKLADRYRVTRQRIGALLKDAAPKKPNAFSAFASGNRKQ